jgi:hypothetical protein
MKKEGLFLSLFLSLQISLYAQTWYINGTTDASLGNQSLIHNNELKIGNSTSATERAKNMIKIGDGSYIQIGEWEADDLLSFKASKYNFTNGNVGIGVTSPQYKLDIAGILNTTNIRTSYLSAHLTDNFTYDGQSMGHYALKWTTDSWQANCASLWLSGYGGMKFFTGGDLNPRFVVARNGNVGVGTASPSALLDVSGDIKATSLSLTGALTTGSLTTGGDLQIGNAVAPMDDYGKKLYFGVSGENTDRIFISRFNVSDDMSELRVSIGDDYNDKFVVGRKFWDQPNFEPMFTVVTNGNVGIGTSNPANKLDVKGIIRATEVKIETGWADFVFNDDYHLKPLSEVNTFIQENKHLPDIPSAAEIKENEGVNLGEMQVKLLQKIEELTLYLIQQESTIQKLKNELEHLKNQ